MRVPDLDWPTDLFADAATTDEPCAQDPTEAYASLWLVLRQLWTGGLIAVERPGFAA